MNLRRAGVPRRRFWLDAALAVLAVAGLVAALRWPDWIERTTGAAPDATSGELEAALAVGLGVLALVSAALAVVEWRRSRAGAVPD
jgi:hypothetical protein